MHGDGISQKRSPSWKRRGSTFSSHKSSILVVFRKEKIPGSLDFSTFPGVSSSSRRQDSKYLPPHNINKQEVYSTPFSLYPTLYPFCNHSCNYFLSSLKSTIKRLPLSIDPKPTGLISTSNRNLNVPVIPLQYLSI